MTALMRAINTSSSCGAHVKVAEKLIAAGPNLNLQNKVCMYKSSADGVCSLFGHCDVRGWLGTGLCNRCKIGYNV